MADNRDRRFDRTHHDYHLTTTRCSLIVALFITGAALSAQDVQYIQAVERAQQAAACEPDDHRPNRPRLGTG